MTRMAVFGIVFLAAAAAFGQEIAAVRTVGSASIPEKRKVRRLMGERVVGRSLADEEVRTIVGKLSGELLQKGYSIKLAFVPTVGESPDTVTVSVDFLTRRELSARAVSEAAARADGAVLSRRPSRWMPNPGGVIKRVRLIGGDMDFCDKHDVLDWVEEALRGKALTAENEDELLAAAREKVVAHGFPLATVTAAKGGAYNENTGTYSVSVDPGRFGDLVVHFGGETNTWFHSNEQVVKRAKAIRRGDVFTLGRVNDALDAINAHPDYSAHAGVEIYGDAAKTGDIILNVDDSIPVHANFEVNNYGMEDIDRWQFTGALQLTNLTRHDDVLTVAPGSSMNLDLNWISGGYLLPFDWLNGGYLNLYGGASKLDTDEVLPDFDLIGNGAFAGGKLAINLVDTTARTLSFDLGVMWRYTEDKYNILGESLVDRNVHTLPATVGLTYGDKKTDPIGGRWYGNVQFLFNTFRDGNSLDDYWYGAEDDYYVGSFDLARRQLLHGIGRTDVPEWRRWSAFARIHGQITDQRLVSAEKLVLGGNGTVRGYRTRGYQGDSGAYGTLEFRTPVWTDPLIGIFSDREKCMPISRWQFLAFVDAGYLKYNQSDLGNYEEEEWLASFGLGLRLSLSKYFQISADVAFPLRKAYLDDKDDDVEFYLSSRLQF